MYIHTKGALGVVKGIREFFSGEDGREASSMNGLREVVDLLPSTSSLIFFTIRLDSSSWIMVRFPL